MFRLVACYSFLILSLRPHSLSSHPGSLVADWCVILMGSFCAASESIPLSVNGWSTVGGGSAEGSQSLSPELSQLTAHFPAPSLCCDIYSKYLVRPLMSISGVFLYFSLLFLLTSKNQRPPPPVGLWACCQPCSRVP